MRCWGVALLGAAAIANAQTPDLALKLDLNLSYTQSSGGKTRFRWYDPMGRHSTVGVGMNLEPGYYILVTERLGRIDSDADREQIDEAYLEDPGVWRIGRQYLPFGAKNMVREAALGARLDTYLFTHKLPVKAAIFDNGAQSLRGAMVRFGSSLGLTLAYGEHIGAASTSFGQIHDPQDAPGKGAGYRVAAAFDATKQVGSSLVVFEAVSLRRPQRGGDRSEDFSDLSVRLNSLDQEIKTTFAWTRAWKTRDDFYRVESEYKISKNLTMKGFLRFQRGTWRDISLGLRVRM
jgi:hypothetical protein